MPRPPYRRRSRCGPLDDGRSIDLARVLEGLEELSQGELAEEELELAELIELDELAYYDPDEDHHPHPEL